MSSYNQSLRSSKWMLLGLCGGASLLAVNCGFSDAPTPAATAGSGTGNTGNTPATGGSPPTTAGSGVGNGGAGPSTGGTSPTAGAGPSTAGAGPSTGGTGGMQGGGTFKNYSVTGSWPTQPVEYQPAPGTLVYTKIALHDRFLAESCSIADYNQDGIVDVSAGRRWYEGPFGAGIPLKEHIFRGGHDDLPRAGESAELVTGVSDDWSCFPYDMDGDSWTDIINIASADVDETKTPNQQPAPQPHATAKWYKNPGAAGVNGMWQSYDIHGDVRQEQHGLVDVDGDGKPEIYGACKGCNPTETRGYYYADWTKPTQAWTYRPVTTLFAFPFSGTGWLHGLGFGDVNKDGKSDLLERGGIWTNAMAAAPDAAARIAVNLYGGTGNDETQFGGAHMFAADVDGDGDNDIISADFAHGYGMSWWEQTAPTQFTKHKFVGGPAEAAMFGGVQFSQPHALQVADMDGDGIVDVVTGKMRFAHPNGYGDPDLEGVPYNYVFKVTRAPSVAGPVTFTAKQIDTSANKVGVGRQIAVGYIGANGNPMANDGIMDFCTANKLGLYVFIGQ